MTQPTPRPDAPLLEKAAVLGLTWLVPGLGYGLKKDWKYFFGNFLLLELTFGIGLVVLRAPVLAPLLDYSSDEFSAINILVFAGQMLNGLLAILSYLDFNRWGNHLFAAKEQLWPADLGAFYLLVGGAMNFFVVLGVYDRYYAARPAEEPAAPATESR